MKQAQLRPFYTLEEDLFGAKIVITIYNIEEQLAKLIAYEAYDEALRLQKNL